MRPGDVIKFSGDEWVAVGYDAMHDTWQLRSTTRARPGWYQSGSVMAMDLGGGRYSTPVQCEVTTAELAQDAHNQAQANERPYEQMKRNLAEYGIDVDEGSEQGSAVRDMVVNVSDQIERMMKAFTIPAEVQMDRRWEDPAMTGWHVIVEEPEPETEFLAFDPSRKAHAVTDLAEAWVWVDFCIDEELGNPRAIKKDDRVIYVCTAERDWRRVRQDYPPVSQWL